MFKYLKFISLILLLISLISCQPQHVTKAKVYIEQERWVEAKESLEKAVAMNPYDPEIYFLLGKVYKSQGQIDKMNEMFDKSLEISPNFKSKIEKEREGYHIK